VRPDFGSRTCPFWGPNRHCGVPWKSAKFDNAIADFAETYADQNERDHAALSAAVAAGLIEAHSGLYRRAAAEP
jgi:hypothetical protein